MGASSPGKAEDMEMRLPAALWACGAWSGTCSARAGVGCGHSPRGWGQRGHGCLGCSFCVPVFIYKMKRLEGISLLVTVRFHDSVGCFGLKFFYVNVPLLKLSLTVYSVWDLVLDVGEREPVPVLICLPSCFGDKLLLCHVDGAGLGGCTGETEKGP